MTPAPGSTRGSTGKEEEEARVGIHWVTPTVISLNFAAGILLAVGHHLFYHSLNGQIAPTGGYAVLGTKVSRQQLNVAIGTGFAFLVRMFLVIAISAAYVQLLWRAMKRPSRPITLKHLDVVFAGLTNLFALGRLDIYWRFPWLLLLIVLISWLVALLAEYAPHIALNKFIRLVPFASVITPATLSVEANTAIRLTVQQVPNVQWVSFYYVSTMPAIAAGAEHLLSWAYEGPSSGVLQTVNEVASTGTILQLQSSSLHADWTLDYAAPVIQCNEVEQSRRSQIIENIALGINYAFNGTVEGYILDYVYLSWTSGLPFTESGRLNVNSTSQKDWTSGFYIVAFPPDSVGDSSGKGYFGFDDTNWYLKRKSFNQAMNRTTMLHCGLVNATLHSYFEYTDGVQIIRTEVERDSSRPIVPSTVEGNKLCIDMVRISALSYQALFDAFQNLITGSIYQELHTVGYNPFAINSNILNTVLYRTTELEYLSGIATGGAGDLSTIQDTVSKYFSSLGLTNHYTPQTTGSLATALEELFLNATISMMTSPQLSSNLASPYAPQPVTVRHHIQGNVYEYSAVKLWIAYGLAILFSGIAITIGVVALLTNGAAYDSNFSNIFCVAQGVPHCVKPEDVDGRDPLPEYLSNVEISLAKTDALAPSGTSDVADPVSAPVVLQRRSSCPV